METINRERISEMVKEKLGLSLATCDDLVLKTFMAAEELLIRDGTLKIKNFGSFSIHKKSARPGFNMHTKQIVEIAPRNVVRLVPSNNFKKALNECK